MISRKFKIEKRMLFVKLIGFTSLLLTGNLVLGQESGYEKFPLKEVRLLKSPFLDAQQTDLKYMLKLDPDRLLAPFLREAGLKPKASSYGNWEDTGLDGHTAGHYLTALAQMYAATGNELCKKRLDYMVNELKRCQDNRTDGYVGGVPQGPQMWAQLKLGNFELFNKKWVPWYNLHKLFAGLRDAYLIARNEQARQVLIKLTDWADKLLSHLTTKQVQDMLRTEQGGMNEVCADVAVITGDKKYLVLAKKFSDEQVLDPLESHQDKLNGLHANTQIPKVIGFERIGQLGHDHNYQSAADFFWETVVKNRSISIGGNSVREHFNPANNFLPMLESEQGPETCNSYNMLKLTAMLFLDKPNASYMDYYERTLYNHILSSQHPEGGFVYFTPIRPQHYRVYSTAENSFWCCVGTGMENHGKYGEMIYSHRGNDLYVNLFIASVLNWQQKGIKITQQNTFPFTERSEIRLSLKHPQTFKIYIRQPGWLKGGGYKVMVNEKIVTDLKADNGYISILRRWNSNDKITVLLPMKDKLEYLPDHSSWATIIHGPIVLAAATDTTTLTGLFADDSRMGHVASGPLFPFSKSPLLVIKNGSNPPELHQVNDKPLTYHIANNIEQPQYKNLTLKPFFAIHDTRYMLYWPVASPSGIKELSAELAADDNVVELSKKTVDQVSPGEQQPESDHFMESSGSGTGTFKNRHWRNATGFFSYQMKLTPAVKSMQITYEAEKNTDFDILLNNETFKQVHSDAGTSSGFITKSFEIPQAYIIDKGAIKIKFKANNNATPKIFDLRLLK